MWEFPTPKLLINKGFKTTENRLKEYFDVFESDLELGIYYLYACCSDFKEHTDEFLKLMLGSVLKYINDNNIPINEIYRVISPTDLQRFYFCQLAEMFSSNDGKKIIIRIIKKEQLDIILKDYNNKISIDDIQFLLNKLFEQNPKQVNKAKKNIKLRNWFVGQIMKETKGQSDPEVIKNLINKII